MCVCMKVMVYLKKGQEEGEKKELCLSPLFSLSLSFLFLFNSCETTIIILFLLFF